MVPTMNAQPKPSKPNPDLPEKSRLRASLVMFCLIAVVLLVVQHGEAAEPGEATESVATEPVATEPVATEPAAAEPGKQPDNEVIEVKTATIDPKVRVLETEDYTVTEYIFAGKVERIKIEPKNGARSYLLNPRSERLEQEFNDSEYNSELETHEWILMEW